MILVDWQIRKWALNMHGIHPYDEEMINPASIDLRLGEGWIDVQHPSYMRTDSPITIYQITLGTLLHNSFIDKLYRITKSAKVLCYRRPTAVLLTTHENIILPRNMAGQIKLKTTPCREGLGHPIADWIDNGFAGQLTMMVTANKTIVMYPGQRICQLVLHTTKVPDVTYDKVGHYQHQMGATASWRNV